VRSLAAVVIEVLLLASLTGNAQEAPAPATASDGARGTLRGVVLNRLGQPVAGAAIVLAPVGARRGEIAAQTDIRGEFKLALAPGRYRARVARPGFRSLSTDEISIVGGRTRRLNLTLVALPSPEVLPLAPPPAE
jgi:hypothetical protein